MREKWWLITAARLTELLLAASEPAGGREQGRTPRSAGSRRLGWGLPERLAALPSPGTAAPLRPVLGGVLRCLMCEFSQVGRDGIGRRFLDVKSRAAFLAVARND